MAGELVVYPLPIEPLMIWMDMDREERILEVYSDHIVPSPLEVFYYSSFHLEMVVLWMQLFQVAEVHYWPELPLGNKYSPLSGLFSF